MKAFLLSFITAICSFDVCNATEMVSCMNLTITSNVTKNEFGNYFVNKDWTIPWLGRPGGHAGKSACLIKPIFQSSAPATLSAGDKMTLKDYRVIQSRFAGPFVVNELVIAEVYRGETVFGSIACSYKDYTIESFNNTYGPELKIDIEASEYCN